MRFSRSPRGLLTVLGVAAATGAAAVSAVASSGRTVALRNIAFSPSKVVVPRGATVTFAFHDGRTKHNVTSVGVKRFKSSGTRNAGTYVVRFTKAGVYRYECTLHPGMKGTVTVK